MYNLLIPILDRPTAKLKTACTKFGNWIKDSTDLVKAKLKYVSEIADSKASFEGDLAVKNWKLKNQSTSSVHTWYYFGIHVCHKHVS